MRPFDQSPNSGVRSYAFLFICQQGELEVKSLLLAASLKRFLRCEHELIAAIPTPAEQWGAPGELTRKLLQEMGVRLVSIHNDIKPVYPLGNKIFCLRVPTAADKLVFIDSDILCLREFHDEPRFAIPFNAKPADLATFSSAVKPWRAVYKAARVAMPTLRMPMTVSGEYGPPYFNS